MGVLPNADYWIAEVSKLRDQYPDFRPDFSHSFRRLIGFQPVMLEPCIEQASRINQLSESGGEVHWSDLVVANQLELTPERDPDERLLRFKRALSALHGLAGRIVPELKIAEVVLPGGYSDAERLSFFSVGENWVTTEHQKHTIQPRDCIFAHILDAVANLKQIKSELAHFESGGEKMVGVSSNSKIENVSANIPRFVWALMHDDQKMIELAKRLNAEALKPADKRRDDVDIARELCGAKPRQKLAKVDPEIAKRAKALLSNLNMYENRKRAESLANVGDVSANM